MSGREEVELRVDPQEQEKKRKEVFNPKPGELVKNSLNLSKIEGLTHVYSRLKFGVRDVLQQGTNPNQTRINLDIDWLKGVLI